LVGDDDRRSVERLVRSFKSFLQPGEGRGVKTPGVGGVSRAFREAGEGAIGASGG
jgi:hypothetical protein